MKKTFIILLGLPIFTLGQQKEDQNVVQGSDLLMTRSTTRNTTIDGSPHIQKEFLQAKVKGYNKIYFLRYNAYEDEMEFKSENEILFLNKYDDLEISFNNLNKTYIFKEYIDEKGAVNRSYLVKLVDEPTKYSLYKKENITRSNGIDGLNSYQTSKNDYYERLKDTFIIEYKNKYYVFLANSKKLPEDFSELSKEYQKKNKLKIIETDLIRFINYLNER